MMILNKKVWMPLSPRYLTMIALLLVNTVFAQEKVDITPFLPQTYTQSYAQSFEINYEVSFDANGLDTSMLDEVDEEDLLELDVSLAELTLIKALAHSNVTATTTQTRVQSVKYKGEDRLQLTHTVAMNAKDNPATVLFNEQTHRYIDPSTLRVMNEVDVNGIETTWQWLDVNPLYSFGERRLVARGSLTPETGVEEELTLYFELNKAEQGGYIFCQIVSSTEDDGTENQLGMKKCDVFDAQHSRTHATEYYHAHGISASFVSTKISTRRP